MPNIPVVENIHQKILAAVSGDGDLEMRSWHSCDTMHCLGGWAVFLAGAEGRKLEKKTSTLFAAMQILKASSPIRVHPPCFFENNEDAMKGIIQRAEEEKLLNTNS